MRYGFTRFFYGICGICVMAGLWGCAQKTKIAACLPPLQTVQCDSMPVSHELLSVTRLFAMDEMLVAYEEQRDTLFSFWKLPECKYLFSAGIRGDGPADFQMLDRAFRPTVQGFDAFEIATSRVKELAVDTACGSLRLLSTRQLDGGQRALNRFLFLEGGRYCCVADDDEHEYLLLDSAGTVKPFGDYPKDLLPEEEGTPKRFTYNKLTVAAPSGKKFAAFYAYVKLCRVYDSEGRLLKEALGEMPEVPAVGEGKRIYYSSHPCATEEAIYVLTESDGQPVLEVWNWEAKLTARYLLPHQFSGIACSPADGKLYAVYVGSEQDMIVRLSL